MNNHESKPYSLRKSRNILKTVYAWYKKKGQKLPSSQLSELEKEMESLDRALLDKNPQQASPVAKSLEKFAKDHCKKSFLEYSLELLIALALALIIATFVRQVWFELYEIPTGSMRPTFKEQDHLTVTKLAFGINYPLETRHIYFDPDLVQRTGILIFSADGLPITDTETTYFWILPYVKRYIKRCIAKPGDSLYFYGGQLYAVDANGNEIPELRQAKWMQDLEYIPFLSFEGDIVPGSANTIYFMQMHKKIGRIMTSTNGKLRGEVFNGKEWVKDQPLAQKEPHHNIQTYSDFLGMRNYAMARLLTKEELSRFPKIDIKSIGEGVLYLQLNHTPSLTSPEPTILRDQRGVSIAITPYTTVIPLQQHHLDAIMDNLYSARFVVSGSRARRYSLSDTHYPPGSPIFPGVPSGTYEFYHGKLSKIYWQGISLAASTDNPLYKHEPSNIQKLFNLGIEMNTVYDPYPQNQTLFPHRYAYFRDGDLYVMGVPILKKDDPTLIAFNESEQKRENQSTEQKPYIAFKDYGPPFKGGKIDADFIRAFGVTVPEKKYLVLGDNHAMSSDSRVFGFVPEANIQGAPSLIIWPPGDRLGTPPQKPYPILNLPRAIVWTIAAIILGIWYALHRRRLKQPIFKKKNFGG